MRSRRMVLLALSIAVLPAVAVWAVQQPARSSRDEPMYRVTDWPANVADQPYGQIVERHLNELAGQGWELDTTLSAQGAKLMVFKRTNRG